MYMGVILIANIADKDTVRAPHVYGGDPGLKALIQVKQGCSPCIWG